MVLKQVIVVRSDLKLPKGKMSAQCAHAAVEAVVRSEKDTVKKWRSEGSMKIIVKVQSLDELYRINQDAKDFGLVSALITDAGRTVIAPGTVTCVGIGPDEEDKIDSVTGNLSLV
jgi:peptidyl-tRNA hydrolase, PTH2 family